MTAITPNVEFIVAWAAARAPTTAACSSEAISRLTSLIASNRRTPS